MEIITKIKQTIIAGRIRLYKLISNLGPKGVWVAISNPQFEALRISATNLNIEIVLN